MKNNLPSSKTPVTNEPVRRGGRKKKSNDKCKCGNPSERMVRGDCYRCYQAKKREKRREWF